MLSLIFLSRNYLDDSEGCRYRQLVIGSFIATINPIMHYISRRAFLANHSGDPTFLQPIFDGLWLVVFPKTKITFESEEISDYWWDSGKYNGAADGEWDNCVRSQGAYFEGGWGIIVLCTMFLVTCILLNRCLYFSYYMTGCCLDKLCILHNYPHRLSSYILLYNM